MRKLPKLWWVWLLGALIMVLSSFEVIRYFAEREVKLQAESWKQAASQFSNADLTQDQADEWLLKSGFAPIYHGSGRTLTTGSPEERYTFVEGYLQISREGTLAKPAWLNLEFLFTPDHKRFVRVRSQVRNFRPYSQESSDN